MKCNKCKTYKNMNQTNVVFTEWFDLQKNLLKSIEYKQVYLCNSCGAIQDLTNEGE